MNTEKNQGIVRKGGRWLRVGLLTFTMIGPAVNTFIERMRHRSRLLSKQTAEAADTLQDTARTAQAAAVHQVNEFTRMSRKRTAKQAQQLQRQSRQVQAQARQLRKALLDEARQRRKIRKLTKQLRKTSGKWSQELLKRGERLTGELVDQGSRLSHELVERSGKLTHELTKSGSRLTHDLTKRGGKLTHDLVERGEHLLHPRRKQNRTFWTIFGFSVGLIVATVTTYLFVRRRMVQQITGESEQIELPEQERWNSVSNARPAGQIRHIDQDGIAVTTLETIDVENAANPAEAVFVGVVSTKRYFPLEEASIETEEVIYFVSEEEALAQGFIAAE